MCTMSDMVESCKCDRGMSFLTHSVDRFVDGVYHSKSDTLRERSADLFMAVGASFIRRQSAQSRRTSHSKDLITSLAFTALRPPS